MDFLIETLLPYGIALVAVGLWVICWIMKENIKIYFYICYIVEDINRTYKWNFKKSKIRALVFANNPKYKRLFRVEDLFGNKYKAFNNLLYRRAKYLDNIALTYNIINVWQTFSQSFSYELFEHCEKRVIHEDNSEHEYMQKCLDRLLDKYPEYKSSTDLLGCLCRLLLKIDYYFFENRYPSTISLNRMISYVEKAKGECAEISFECLKHSLSYPSYEKEFDRVCSNYIEEIKEYWEEYKKH